LAVSNQLSHLRFEYQLKPDLFYTDDPDKRHSPPAFVKGKIKDRAGEAGPLFLLSFRFRPGQVLPDPELDDPGDQSIRHRRPEREPHRPF
jgi:hypothetical protein